MSDSQMPRPSYLFLVGMVLLVFGCVAVSSPAVAGTSVVIVIGVILVAAGIAQLFHGIGAKSWSSKLLSLVLGAITLLGGLAVLAHPWLGLTVLTLVMAVYFVVEGLWKIVASFTFRPASGWLAVLASGVIGLVLGLLIWMQWPLSGLWAVGILVGVDLIATGVAMLALAWTVRSLKPAT